jgi:hypothetical protein
MQEEIFAVGIVQSDLLRAHHGELRFRAGAGALPLAYFSSALTVGA